MKTGKPKSEEEKSDRCGDRSPHNKALTSPRTPKQEGKIWSAATCRRFSYVEKNLRIRIEKVPTSRRKTKAVTSYRTPKSEIIMDV
jgi:hypothetical protein